MFKRVFKVRTARLAARLGNPTTEQVDLLLSRLEYFQGDDLADMLKANPNAVITEAQWDIILDREYFPVPVAAVHGLPQHVLRRMATHPNEAVRNEVYINPSSDDDTKALAAATGVSEAALDGTLLAERADGLRRALSVAGAPTTGGRHIRR